MFWLKNFELDYVLNVSILLKWNALAFGVPSIFCVAIRIFTQSLNQPRTIPGTQWYPIFVQNFKWKIIFYLISNFLPSAKERLWKTSLISVFPIFCQIFLYSCVSSHYSLLHLKKLSPIVSFSFKNCVNRLKMSYNRINLPHQVQQKPSNPTDLERT